MARATGYAHRRSTGCGRPFPCSPTAARPSSSRRTRTSWTRCATSSGCTWTRHSMPWFFVWTRSPRFRPSIAPSPCCRCGPARSSGALMTTSAMARPRCSPPSTSPPGRSSDSATGATAARSSGSSWITSRPTFRPTSTSTSSWTTTRPTRRRRSATGSPGVRAGMSISRRPLPHGSNQVERFFADLTEKQIRRGVHRSTAELERAITDYIETVNEAPKPFRWHKTADDILASIKRFCLRTIENRCGRCFITVRN